MEVTDTLTITDNSVADVSEDYVIGLATFPK